MIGFYCATPYHLLIAIHLAITKYKNCETNLILMNHFSDAESVVCKLKTMGLFSHVYLLNQSNKTFFQKIKRTLRFIKPDAQIKKFMKHDYSEFVFFANDFMNFAYIIKKFSKKNVNTVFSYAEDGIGTYVEKLYEPSKIIHTLLLLTNRKKYLEKIKKLYVFRPDLMLENEWLDIEAMPPICMQNQELLQYISKIWDISDAEKIDKKVIYFEQPIQIDFQCQQQGPENEILQIIKKNVQTEDLIIKLHPRSHKDMKGVQTFFSTVPFECLFINLNIEEKILISPLSTAVFSPKIILDEEPIVILTYELFPEYKKAYSEVCEKIEKFAEKIRHIYSSKDRIYIPHNMEEFSNIINRVC